MISKIIKGFGKQMPIEVAHKLAERHVIMAGDFEVGVLPIPTGFYGLEMPPFNPITVVLPYLNLDRAEEGEG
jgi:hypothetical protein